MDRRAWRLADFGWAKPPRIAPALLPALAGLVLAALILAVSPSHAAVAGPPIPPGWTDAERWAWQEIAAERVADFNQRYGETLDPAKPDGWDNAKKPRRLSAAFLKTILTQKPFKEATPDAGVEIRGGWFPEPIELTGSVLGGLIWLGESRFEELIDLVAARLAGSLALVDSVIVHELDLSSATLEGSVFLNGAIIDGVAARLVKLGGQLNLSGGRYEFVDLEAGNIQDGIIIKDAEISEALHVRGGVVGGQVMIAGSKIGELNLNGIIIKRGFFLHHSYLAKDANLRGMQPGTGIDIAGSLLDAVDMDSVRVDGGAYFAESEFNGPLSLRGAKIGGQLALIEGRFAQTILESVSIGESIIIRNGSELGGELTISGSTVSGNVDLDRSSYKEVVLDGIDIKKELLMEDGVFNEKASIRGANIGGFVSLSRSMFNDELILAAVI